MVVTVVEVIILEAVIIYFSHYGHYPIVVSSTLQDLYRAISLESFSNI